MPSALDKMSSSVHNASEVLREIKSKTGRKMIGVFHPVVPEELIYAAGLHPVRISPYYEDSITVGDSYLQIYLCSILRADWDQIIKGKYSFLDGAIIPRSCEAITFLYQTWKRHNPYPFIDYINVPWKRSDNAISFFAKELGRVKKNLEAFTGNEISEDSLLNAIRVYNRNRELLRKVYDLRKVEAPPISGSEAIHVVMSSLLFDKEEHNGLLEQLLKELAKRPQRPKADIRLLISGGCVIDLRMWELIESLGASIVADDVNNGSRSFWHSVEETEKEPLEALARAYATVPCAFNTSITDRFKFVGEMITECKVHGVIFAMNKNCESEKFVYPELDKKIRERFNLSTLNIETDYLMNLVPLRTRVEAFIEMLRG
ncbi:MAG: 2-hydroxyacyl-CoA dehydratase family protein [Desulfobacteraceae bacterium]|jgi:benzoyl-CoA reductase subunit C